MEDLSVEQTNFSEEERQNPKVLVVDDDPDYLAILKMCLSLDYQVVGTSSAFEALDIFDSTFESVIIDYVLSEMSGVELAEILSAKYARPMLLITSYGSKSLKIEDISKFFAILTKPIEPQELVLKVQQSIYQNRNIAREKIAAEVILDNALEGIFTCDEEGLVQSWNQQAQVITEYSFGKIYQNNISLLFEDSLQWTAALKTLELEDSYTRELILLNARGKKIPCLFSVKNLEVSGEKECLMGSFIDLTRFKESQKHLTNFTSRFMAVSEFQGHLLKKYLHMQMAVFDENKNLLTWDPQFWEVFGMEKKENRRADEIFPPKIIEKLDQALSGEHSIYEGKISPGSSKWYRIIFDPMQNEDGEMIGALMMNEDITKYHQMKEQLLHQEKMGALETLAQGMAHEYNNLLTSISGSAELILHRTQMPEIVRDSQRILQSVQRASDLTTQLLDLVELEKGYLEEIHLLDFLKELVEEEQKKGTLSEDQIDLSLTLPEELPPFKGDPKLLKKALTIFLENGYHSLLKRPKKEVHIEVTEESGKICISIKDTGSGIEPENLHRIFEPFFTTKGPLSGSFIEGRGLGLSIADNILRKHGGTIQVSSEKNQGTQFKIFLPLASEAEEQSKGK